ncbi:MAG: PAS domain S-box protein [Holosporaceae bacterium]|nr:PAS domain S-box protein [Holosporaceae bacterium]
MLNKIIATLKTTVIIWIGILAPLIIAGKFLKMSTREDAFRCIDSFMVSEGVGLSKYIGSQLENTLEEFRTIIAETHSDDLNDKEVLQEKVNELAKRDKNVAALNICDEEGKILASSSNAAFPDFSLDDFKDLKDETLSYVGQRKEGEIVLKYAARKKDGDKNFYFEMIVKWDRYEKYMRQMSEGSFQRIFYIISPDCQRYVSLNALPGKMKGDRNVVALGMRLAKTIKEIPFGLSDRKVDSFSFRIFKDEIKLPAGMQGSKFFVVIATNDETLNSFSEKMFDSMQLIIAILIVVWLAACLAAAGFYTKTKTQLEISNSISDSTPLAVVIFKVADGKIMKVNLAAITLLRIEKENLNELNMWDLFANENDKGYITIAVSSKINVLNYEVMLQPFGGGIFWAICSASPIEVEEEKYVVFAILDINRRKEVEKKLANNAALLEKQVAERTADLESKAKQLEESSAELEKAKQAADSANAAKSKFLTSMSNELKAPIKAIVGYSEILKEEALDRKDAVSADDLSKVIGSAKHLLSLIDSILDLSRIEAGKTQLVLEDIGIIPLIKDVEGVAMPLVANNNNSLFVEYPKDIGVMYSDATKIRQCLLNLLSNAAKFTEFGRITARIAPLVKDGEDFVEFSVVDTGVGIEADRIDAIFESFQGESKSASFGLGLSLTKKYVEYLGGTITIESELGAGSKFVIRLPRTCKTEATEFIEIKHIKPASDDFEEE